MANSPESTQYNEFVIEKKDFSPVFVWNRIKSQSVWGHDRQIPAIILRGKIDGEEAELVLQDKPYSRFLQFMGLGKRRFMKMMYVSKEQKSRYGRKYVKKSYIGSDAAQNRLNQEYPKATVQKFKILTANNKVVRITSEDYIGIPHTFVQQTIENRLKAEGIEFTKDIRFGGVNGIYTFTNIEGASQSLKKVGDMAHQISYMNRNSGDKSLKLFGGAVVLVCSNGMTSGEATSEMRIVHKLELSVLKRRIEEQLGKLIEKLSIMPKEFLKLRNYEVTKEEAKKLVESLPVAKYLREAIWARLFTPSKETRNGEMDWDGSMWGIYMAATYIASHDLEIRKSRNTKKAVDVEIAEKLSNVDLFTNIWDEREKILEASGAPKQEVRQN